jgi:hypothetical protein
MKNKKPFLWIGISLIALAVIILIIYYVRKGKRDKVTGKKDDTGKGGFLTDLLGDITGGKTETDTTVITPPITGGGGGGGGSVCASPATLDKSKKLSKGSRSPEVCEAQRLIGFTGSDVDGIWGSKTQAGVEKVMGKRISSISLYTLIGCVKGGVC